MPRTRLAALILLLSTPLISQAAPIQVNGPQFEQLCIAFDKMLGWIASLEADASSSSPTATKSSKLLPFAKKRLERLAEAKGRTILGRPMLGLLPGYLAKQEKERGIKAFACTMPLTLDVPQLDQGQCRAYRPGLQEGEETVFDPKVFGQQPSIRAWMISHEMHRLDQTLTEYEAFRQISDGNKMVGLSSEFGMTPDQIKQGIAIQVNQAVMSAVDESFLQFLRDSYAGPVTDPDPATANLQSLQSGTDAFKAKGEAIRLSQLVGCPQPTFPVEI